MGFLAAWDAETGFFFGDDGTSPPCPPEERGAKDGAPEVDWGGGGADAGGLESEVCAAAGENPAEHTRTHINVKRKNLRRTTTTL